MAQDRLIQLRISEDLYDRLIAVGRDLAKVRPGLDFSVSALVRAAISAWVEPPKRDPDEIILRLPADVPDADAVDACDLLSAITDQAREVGRPGVAALLDGITDAVMTRYMQALIRRARANQKT